MGSKKMNVGAEGALASAERLLEWADERLLGTHEGCWSCMGDGYFVLMDGSEEWCDSCNGKGVVLRTSYVNAEAALTPEERAQIGEQYFETTSDSSLWDLDDKGGCSGSNSEG